MNKISFRTKIEAGLAILLMVLVSLAVIGARLDLTDSTITYSGPGEHRLKFYNSAGNDSDFYIDSDNSSTTRLFIDGSSGNVGIGTTSPSQKLHINTSGGNELQYALKLQNPDSTTGSATGIGFAVVGGVNPVQMKAGIVFERRTGSGRGKIHFLQNNEANNDNADLSDAVVTISQSGNIGINTTSPTTPLYIVSDISQTDSAFIALNDSQTGGKTFYINNGWVAPGIGGFYFGGQVMAFNESNGNVGIGTTSPSTKLEVSGNVTADYYFGDGSQLTNLPSGSSLWTNSSGNATFTSGRVGIGTTSPSTKLEVSGNVTADYYFGDGSQLTNLPSGSSLWTNSSGNATFTSGNVGIGTTTPSAALDVIGVLEVSNEIQILDNGSATDPSLTWENDGNTGIFTAGANILGFTTDGSEAMRIDSSGNIGIGDSSPDTPLHITKQSADASNINNLLILEVNDIAGSFNLNNGVGGGILFKIPDDDATGKSEIGARISAFKDSNGDTSSASGLIFEVSGDDTTLDEAMRIRNHGYVGIGDTTPDEKLHVGAGNIELDDNYFVYWGDSDRRVGFDGTQMVMGSPAHAGVLIDDNNNQDTAYFAIKKNSATFASATEIFRVQENGNVGIGTSSLSYRLQVGETSNYGYVDANGAWQTGSDVRFKENVVNITNALDKVGLIRAVRYNVINDPIENQQIGFIAQELEEVIPEIVSTDDNGYKGIAYAKLTPVLTKAIQELKAENDFLKEQSLEQQEQMEFQQQFILELQQSILDIQLLLQQHGIMED